MHKLSLIQYANSIKLKTSRASNKLTVNKLHIENTIKDICKKNWLRNIKTN